jgi:hypothetical protein
MYYMQPYIKLVGDTDVCVFDIPIPCTNMIDRLCLPVSSNCKYVSIDSFRLFFIAHGVMH